MKAPLEYEIGRLLRHRHFTLAFAESCTGGLASSLITDVPGCSDYFLGAVVSYANSAKEGVLDVKRETLARHGAVSAEAASEMARSARRVLGADIGVAITGVAGPGGGSEDKPVGLTYIHLSAPDAEIRQRHIWQGDRLTNKRLSAEAALGLLLDYLRGDAVA